MSASSPELAKAITEKDVDSVENIFTAALGTAKHRDLLAEGLSLACERGHLQIVRRLISLGADFTTRFGTRSPPFISAVKKGYEDIVKYLLENDYDNDSAKTERKGTLLRRGLVLTKSKSIGELLIYHGADYNYQDKEDKSCKTVLMNVRNPEIVELLVEKGVKVEAKDYDGNTALIWTLIVDEDPTIAKILIESGGADIDATDNGGRTPIMTAIWKSRMEILKILIDREANVRAKDMRGRHALHHLASDKTRVYKYQADAPSTQQEHDSRILDMLLQTNIGPKETDNHDRTCLHWAASLRCSGVLKLLLQKLQINVNAVEHRSKTPLHFAAANGDFESAEMLLNEDDVEIDVESDGGWTALHCACGAKGDSVPLVKLFIDHEALVRKKTQNGQTLLHIAVEAGNVSIVRFLLEETDVKRTTRDAFGNTPLLSCGKIEQRVKEEILGLFAPWNNVHTLSMDAEEAAKKFRATVVDFAGPRKSQGKERPKAWVKTPSVFDLLYKKHFRDPNKPEMKVFDEKKVGQDGFRWIHFPANNVPWCQDLFTKCFIEGDAAVSTNSFRALERSFNHQHRGHEPQARYMTPVCQSVIRPWGSEEVTYPYESGSGSDPSREDTIDEQGDQPVLRPASPEIPQNLPRRVILSLPEPQQIDSPVEEVYESNNKSSYPWKYDAQLMDDGSPVSDFYVFMPYLHFETYQARQEMQDIYLRVLDSSVHKFDKLPKDLSSLGHSKNEAKENTNPAQDKDHTLLRAHLNTSDQVLHIRRTLDQSFYHHINTKDRDKDQVIHRFQKKFDPARDHKVLMVDQLWLYVIGENLVVTSFPQRWKQPKRDPLNILESILAIINSTSREPVRTVHELAMIITGRCYGAYDRHGVGSDDTQFLDMFEGWIGAAMDDEVKLFNRFKRDSAHASEWLQTDKSMCDIARAQSQQSETQACQQEEYAIVTCRSSKASDFVKNLLDIGSETELLEEIKDIQDELDMLSLVFRHQAHVLPSIKETIEAIMKHGKWPTAVKGQARKALDDHMRTIQHPQREIVRMEGQAKRIYYSIRDLLDLKQKHANAIEARYAREQQNDTSKQGQVLMIFTIFTVVFLPLSFVVALFAIDIKELPHTDGVQVLTAGFVAKNTAAGTIVAIACVIIALKVPAGYTRLKRWWGGSGKAASLLVEQTRMIDQTNGTAQEENEKQSSKSLQRSARFRGTKIQDLESGSSNMH